MTDKQTITSDKTRVGLIGVGTWAQYGHIPVLQSLPDFEIVAIASRSLETAQKYAASFNIQNAFDNEQELINHPDVNLVVILAPAPEHARLVEAAIHAGKDVYSEWPLTTSTKKSEDLLKLAEAKGIRHIVGLQRRLGPAARFAKDLVKEGYIGELRSANMKVSVDAFQPLMPSRYSWAFHEENFSHVLSIYGGHFIDMLFQTAGYPSKLTAVVKNQFPFFTVAETNEKVPTTNPNAAMITGILENGALFSVQIEGAQKYRTGLQIDIGGTEGVLKITNKLAFENKEDNVIEGIKGDADTFSVIPVPEKYKFLNLSHLDASVQDVAYLYQAFANDKKFGTSIASNFKDGIYQHKIIDQIMETSDTFAKSDLFTPSKHGKSSQPS